MICPPIHEVALLSGDSYQVRVVMHSQEVAIVVLVIA
jgi:hypothetical protein